MQGNINLSGNTITNMAVVPAMPNGAAPAQWVLNQIASVSLYQGTWDADTNVPDLTQLSTHVNAYTWIAITTAPAGVVIGPAIPGLQGTTVFNGDTIIYSTVQGGFKAIHSGGITLPEADGRYVQLAGSQMSGALLLNADASQPMQAVPFQQLEAAVANTVTPDAPADGQAYLRVGVGTNRWVPGLPLAGGILTGALTLSGNAAQPLNAVPLQQVNSLITAGTTGFLPLAGGQMTGLMQLSGNATVNLNPVPLQQLNAMLGTYAPIQNPSFTGSVTLPGNAASALQAVPLQQLTAQLAGYLPLTGGTLSGALTMSGTGVAGNITLGPSGELIFGSTGVIFPGTSSLVIAAPGGGNLTNGVTINGVTTTNGLASHGNINIGTSGVYFLQDDGSNRLYNVGLGFALQWVISTGMWRWISNNAEIAHIDIAGNMSLAGTLSQGSDERTKSNIASYAPGVSVVSQLLPKIFTYTADTTNALHLGFMAQDVQPVLPQAVSGSADTSFGLDTTPIVAACVNAIKQLTARVQTLEAAANITPPAAATA